MQAPAQRLLWQSVRDSHAAIFPALYARGLETGQHYPIGGLSNTGLREAPMFCISSER